MPNAIRSVCPFCSMGCTVLLDPGTGAPYVGEADVPQLDYDADGPFNRGSLCAKGNMALELLTSPGRLDAPLLRSDGTHEPASWDEAVGHVATRLEMLRETGGASSIGLLLGPYLTDEEARAAVELGRRIGTPHVDGGQPEDRLLLAGIERSGAQCERVHGLEELEGMTAALIVGDVFTVAPCLAKPVLEARYDRRQNRLGTLGGVATRTAWFGKPDLRCAPAHEAAALGLLLGMALEHPRAEGAPIGPRLLEVLRDRPLEALAGLDSGAARAFVDALMEAESGAVLIAPTFGGSERPDLVAGLAALLARVTRLPLLPVTQGPNSGGVRRVLHDAGFPAEGGLTAPQMIEAAVTGDLDGLLVFGCDPVGAFPGPLSGQAARRLALFAVTAPLRNESSALADVVLPATTWGEKTGTIRNAFDAAMELAAALPPPGAARSDLAILQSLAARIAPHPGPASERSAISRPGDRPDADFLSDLELYFRRERYEVGSRSPGTHVLLPEASPAQAADGGLTRDLSWPRREAPRPEVTLSPGHARALQLRTGDRARVRSSQGEVVLTVRVAKRLPEAVVLAPAHDPRVRGLLRWHVDPVTRDLDLEPGRVSVERAEENGDV